MKTGIDKISEEQHNNEMLSDTTVKALDSSIKFNDTSSTYFTYSMHLYLKKKQQKNIT